MYGTVCMCGLFPRALVGAGMSAGGMLLLQTAQLHSGAHVLTYLQRTHQFRHVY